MLSTCEGSITRCIGDLGTEKGAAAAQQLWERYFHPLVRLARRKLGARAGCPVEDEEDAALSAIDSFCRGAARGRFPRLTDRQDVWRLLAKITERKAFDQMRRGGAIRRGDGWLVNEAGAGLDRFVGREPRPEPEVIVADQYQRLRSRLGNDSLRAVLDLRLEGYNREQIAARMGLTTRTVARKLRVIGTVWMEGEDGS
jgi:DNA-directed RNA polymerase specialized sigma24 family protein